MKAKTSPLCSFSSSVYTWRRERLYFVKGCNSRRGEGKTKEERQACQAEIAIKDLASAGLILVADDWPGNIES